MPLIRFNTCSSCEEQRDCSEIFFDFRKRFNTCSSCEEQPVVITDRYFNFEVSIHAPLARSNFVLVAGKKETGVSIHAPLARSNKSQTYKRREKMFQYMLLLRGATPGSRRLNPLSKFQYMLLLRGATALWCILPQERKRFNTCSSCEEQLEALKARRVFNDSFNTCSSCEEQLNRRRNHCNRLRFNTCSSCEEQLKIASNTLQAISFQYMLLLRGATCKGVLY